ncbi:PfkB family carbohydrate kinase [Streptomyces xantholiticus]|uniref:PfkB family carbohydrate kinase n=1 Tax=Streptomyces xantholiticus TaxID=68285 RepID=A0ABV1V4L8_9ACTN
MNRGGVLVPGEALIDLVPEPDDPEILRAQPGGAPANVAVGLARLGTPVAFAGTLGGDAFAGSIERRLSSAGVDLSLCGRSVLPTTLAVADPGPEGTAYPDDDRAGPARRGRGDRRRGDAFHCPRS